MSIEAQNELLNYRVTKLEDNEEKIVEAVDNVKETVNDIVKEQAVKDKRDKIYIAIVGVIVTALLNVGAIILDKVTSPSEASKKAYYDRRTADSEAMKRVEEEINRINDKLKDE